MTYDELTLLPEGTLVQDPDGQVWRVVQKPRYNEVWLCPFSDEYAETIRPGGGLRPGFKNLEVVSHES